MAYLYALTTKATPVGADYLHLADSASGGADKKITITSLFTSRTLTTPVIGDATGTSLALSGALTAATVNGLAVTSNPGATLAIASNKTLTCLKTLTFNGTDGTTMTFPSASSTIARINGSQTFTGTQTFSDTLAAAAITATSMAASGALLSSSPSAGIGYATGAGGAVTQLTSRTTGVTVSPNPCVCGTITTHTASLAAEDTADFVVTNSAVAIGDVVVVSIRSGSDSGGTMVSVSEVADGSFTVRVHNANTSGGTAETGAIIINFAVLKAVDA